MQLEDYFSFLAPNDIRLAGSRIGIETILYEYIYRSRTPEEIAQTYPSITLEQVYATLLYYLHNKETISKYMAEWLEHCLSSEREQDENPPDFVVRLRQLKAKREATVQVVRDY
jgi:uncharacterized protein (DUF433 family)